MENNPFLFVQLPVFVVVCAFAVGVIVFILTIIFTRSAPVLFLMSLLSIGGSGFAAYANYDKVLNYYTDNWLKHERVYQVLFKDFPQDRQRFVSEYATAFKSGGLPAINEKIQEMKIIISVNYLLHYAGKAPIELIFKHLQTQALLQRALYSADSDICKRYMEYSGNFKEAWKAAGDKLFLESIRYIPEMIVAANDRPEYAAWLINKSVDFDSGEINSKAYEKAKIEASLNSRYRKEKFACLLNAANYEEIIKLEPGKAALVWKYWLKKENDKKHLKN